MLRLLISTIFASLTMVMGALACSPVHVVAHGGALQPNAERTLIHMANWSSVIDGDPNVQDAGSTERAIGTASNIPCPERISQRLSAASSQQENAEIRLITGSNYAPFTDKNWPGQGMLIEVVTAAFEASPAPVPYSVTWDDDWSRHLFPKLDSKEFDMGFPWFRPDCEQDPDHQRCARFHFSDPLIDLAILLFVRTDGPVSFDQDSDLVGHTICRPAGYFTHDLDRRGREWLSQGKITLKQPETPDACFDMLSAGQVDAVALNEFSGVQKIHAMGLQDSVVALERPLSVEGLHVVISKTHWRGTSHLYRFNAGLRALKETDQYRDIVNRHLSLFWDEVKG